MHRFEKEREISKKFLGAIRVSFKQGDVILKEGQRNSCLYRIKSGQVRVEKSKSMVLGYLHKNQGNYYFSNKKKMFPVL